VAVSVVSLLSCAAPLGSVGKAPPAQAAQPQPEGFTDAAADAVLDAAAAAAVASADCSAAAAWVAASAAPAEAR
jgi:hypothetical protein